MLPAAQLAFEISFNINPSPCGGLAIYLKAFGVTPRFLARTGVPRLVSFVSLVSGRRRPLLHVNYE